AHVAFRPLRDRGGPDVPARSAVSRTDRARQRPGRPAARPSADGAGVRGRRSSTPHAGGPRDESAAYGRAPVPPGAALARAGSRPPYPPPPPPPLPPHAFT